MRGGKDVKYKYNADQDLVVYHSVILSKLKGTVQLFDAFSVCSLDIEQFGHKRTLRLSE